MKILRCLHSKPTKRSPVSEEKPAALEADRCPICHEDMIEKVWTKPCSHAFHLKCIMEWRDVLAERYSPLTCPLCQTQVKAYERIGKEGKLFTTQLTSSARPNSRQRGSRSDNHARAYPLRLEQNNYPEFVEMRRPYVQEYWNMEEFYGAMRQYEERMLRLCAEQLERVERALRADRAERWERWERENRAYREENNRRERERLERRESGASEGCMIM
jgi:hypothetical protein